MLLLEHPWLWSNILVSVHYMPWDLDTCQNLLASPLAITAHVNVSCSKGAAPPNQSVLVLR